MSTLFKAGLAAAAAALLCVPAVSTAAYVSSDLAAAGAPESRALALVASATSSTDPVRTQGVLAADFLAQSVNQTGPSATVGSPAGDADAMQSALSATPSRNPVFGGLTGNADLLLWNLVAMVRAQQHRQAFELIDTGITTIHLSEDIAKVSAVPLPGVVWLFVMGVMGLAGVRITGVGKGARRAEVEPGVAPRFGAAVPA